MFTRLLATLATAAFLTTAASAQDAHQGHATGGGDASGLPEACMAAAKPAAGTSGTAQPSGAMAAMHQGMMAAETIEDPDLSFNCGMIAHHKGAIAMAETELKEGRDEASKAMAERIIDAQKREIEEMTRRVEALAK